MMNNTGCGCPTTLYDNVEYPSGYQMGPCAAQDVYDPLTAVEPMETPSMATPAPLEQPAVVVAPAVVEATPVAAQPTVMPTTDTVLTSAPVAGAQVGYDYGNMPSGYEWAPYPEQTFMLGAQVTAPATVRWTNDVRRFLGLPVVAAQVGRTVVVAPAQNSTNWLLPVLLLALAGLLWWNWPAVKRMTGMDSTNRGVASAYAGRSRLSSSKPIQRRR